MPARHYGFNQSSTCDPIDHDGRSEQDPDALPCAKAEQDNNRQEEPFMSDDARPGRRDGNRVDASLIW
ncbi:hypothetical protein BDHH15_50200 [Bradyrhizobium diazoefficiens]|uniref:Uncharacterized protein n=1 Tax=Bradyrhizobium diazoefficiens TaxID=1355477 RepID=A0A810APK3_9BRAD|nr:hypothetical protein H12S4_53520 [Bradyrhizobium diazoefficiens]BCA21805.1 hypothetical protein BDHH15_50200 [Bradyrhizobium diazoefficiens]BCE57432.1 hypothetical protein XF5B_49440 [Bradyrhizobium diazoefficiens]BCE66107.1 hypothetical protein XF6B_49060 [Bradyrhizobium diazoefficiens]BCE84211.1 hypothetical protein XF9B_56320 [Bradyrhizobium diazoefficiens]